MKCKKVVSWPRLGPFDFADLDVCLRLVDREEESGSNAVFLSRALALVEDPQIAPQDLKGVLSHLETVLFFLKYLQSEDLSLCYEEFRRAATGEKALAPEVEGFLRDAERRYPPGSELVRATGADLMSREDVDRLMAELRAPPADVARKDGLGAFREIFYRWSEIMRAKFELLVLPHHTQVACLLVFRRFLEARTWQAVYREKPGAATDRRPELRPPCRA